MFVKQSMTVEEFDEWVLLPENAGRDFEYIGGKIVEVVSNNYSSQIGAFMCGMIIAHNRKHKQGWVTGADGGYKVAGERYMPDVGYISRERQPQRSRASYNPLPPDLAVEVLSPHNEDMPIKIENYLKAGTTVWLVDPDQQTVEIYAPNEAVKKLGIEDTLEGGRVLEGFRLAVREIFEEE